MYFSNGEFMTENLKKEQFSLSYINAIVSACGFTLEEIRVDIDSVDCTIKTQLRADNNRYNNPCLEVQLKATENWQIIDEHINYALNIKNYNDLRDDKVMVPRILVLLCLPKDSSAVVEKDKYIELHETLYFLSLKGSEETENKTSISLKIPIANILSIDKLKTMLQNLANGEEI